MEKMRGNAGRWIARLASLLAVAALAACGGGGGGEGAAQGTLRMSLTDAPACYENVFVTVEKVRVHAAGSAAESDAGWEDIVPPNAPLRIDLLALTNGELADLGSSAVPAGGYAQVRLVLAANTGVDPLANAVKPVGGALVPLKTPSAQQSGLKIKGNFAVEAGGTTDMLLDFDACKSVVKAGSSGQYILKPVVRLTPHLATSIRGHVTTTMALTATTISAQQGGTIVRSTAPAADGSFVLASLPIGTYTVVISSSDRATAVITGVPVSAASPVTSLGDSTSAIVLPSSAMHAVSGTVTAATGGSGKASLVTDATVTALQDLAVAGTTIQLASTPVDFDLATYAFTLPAAAPVSAPYASAGLVFATETAAAGKYRLQATAPGRATLEQAVDASTADATADFAY